MLLFPFPPLFLPELKLLFLVTQGAQIRLKVEPPLESSLQKAEQNFLAVSIAFSKRNRAVIFARSQPLK